MFKTVICDENDKRFIKKILESILSSEIKEISYMKSERPKLIVSERSKIVDLIVKTKDNKIIHLELNNGVKNFTYFRNYAYLSSIIATETKAGGDYDINKDYIHIDLTYSNNKRYKRKNFISEHYIQTDFKERYINNVKIIEVDMDSLKSLCYNKDEYKYLLMLDMQPKELLEKYKGDELIMEYKKKVEEINADEDKYRYMTAEEAYEKERNTDLRLAKEEGLTQGKEEGKIEMIKSMKKNGMELDFIAKISELSTEEVESIIA